VDGKVVHHHHLGGLGGEAGARSVGADGESVIHAKERLGQADRGRAAQDGSLRAGGFQQMDAQHLLVEGGSHGRDDQRERGPRLHVRELVDQAPQPLQLTTGHRVHLDAGHEPNHIGALDLQRGDVGNHPPLTQDHDAIGQAEHLLKVVGDQQDPGASFPDLPDQGLDLERLDHAERRRGLVQDQQARTRHQGPAKGHQLTLAAGEGSDRSIQRQRAGAHPLQDGGRLLVHAGVGEEQTALPAQGDVRHDVEVVAQTVVLPEDLHPRLSDLVGSGRHGRALEVDLALVGLDDPGKAGHQRGLPGPGFPHQRHHLAPGDPERHIPQRRDRTEAFGEADHIEERGRGGLSLVFGCA
jgi:hypothetical protein